MITASPDGGFDHCYLHASYSAQQTVMDESMDGRTTAVYTEALTPAMVSQRLHGGCILRHSGTPWQDARGKLRRTLKRMRRRAGSNYTVRDQYNMQRPAMPTSAISSRALPVPCINRQRILEAA